MGGMFLPILIIKGLKNMLKLANKSTYKRSITVDVPLDMGKTERSSFVMEFKRLSVTETKELIEESTFKSISDEDMLQRYAVSWEGVVDDDGKDLVYNRANLERVLDVPYIRKAIMNAFIEDVFGKEATRKN